MFTNDKTTTFSATTLTAASGVLFEFLSSLLLLALGVTVTAGVKSAFGQIGLVSADVYTMVTLLLVTTVIVWWINLSDVT